MALRSLRRILVSLFIGAIIVSIWSSGIVQYLTLEQIKEHISYFNQMVHAHYIVSALCFIGAYIAAAGLLLPGVMVLTLTGGYLFGTLLGAFYTTIGATVGSTIAFLVVRYIVGSSIQRRYAQHLLSFNKQLEHNGALYLLLIHFVAVIPFFLINLLAGLTNVSVWTFIWTTFVGVIPTALIYSFAGQQLTVINSIRDIFTWQIGLALFCLGMLSLIPLLFSRKKV